MKINKKKLIAICIIFIISILFISQVVQAKIMGEGAEESILNPEDYKPSSTSSVSGASKLEEIGNNMIGVIQVIGSISSVIALVIIGIKYVVGSAEEKAEYKQTLKPYLIGAILLFGITNILSIIVDVMAVF